MPLAGHAVDPGDHGGDDLIAVRFVEDLVPGIGIGDDGDIAQPGGEPLGQRREQGRTTRAVTCAPWSGNARPPARTCWPI